MSPKYCNSCFRELVKTSVAAILLVQQSGDRTIIDFYLLDVFTSERIAIYLGEM